MRKYFLISDVALITETNVNASEPITGSMKVNVDIKNVTQLSCSDLNFGTVYLKANNQASTVKTDGTVTGDVIQTVGAESAECEGIQGLYYNLADLEILDEASGFGTTVGEGEYAEQLQFSIEGYIPEESHYAYI